MSLYPNARLRLVERYKFGNRLAVPMDRFDCGVDHTAVANWTSNEAFAWFNTSGHPVPHFWFNEDGTVDQYIDTNLRSSAVLNGNHRCITWETWDGWPDAWSQGQAPFDNDDIVLAKAELMVWLHQNHSIPLNQLTDSRSTSRGMGWHRLGIDGNFPSGLLRGRVPDGENWSRDLGKTCPTDRRIVQFVERTLPIAQGELMAITPGDLDKIANAVWQKQVFVPATEETLPAVTLLRVAYVRSALLPNLAKDLSVELNLSKEIIEQVVEATLRKVLGSLDA